MKAQIGKKNIEQTDLKKLVKGLYFNTKENLCSFVLSEPSKQMAAIAGKGTGIDLNDLAVALFVYCSEEAKYKHISFSLDPADEKNPHGDFQKKVVYPDA